MENKKIDGSLAADGYDSDDDVEREREEDSAIEYARRNLQPDVVKRMEENLRRT